MEPKASSAADNGLNQPATRKPYSKPQVQQYGDLAEITKSVGGTMTNDGSGNPNMHFTS
jgi:hypothetical protein